MTDEGILSEFTGSEHIFKVLHKMDEGRRRKVFSRNELNASTLKEGLMKSMQQPRQEKCCAVNKHHGTMEITMCLASMPYLSDNKAAWNSLFKLQEEAFCARHLPFGRCVQLVSQGGHIVRNF